MTDSQQLAQFAFDPCSIASLCNATCLRGSDARITNVQIDSRQCTSGSLFFALKGEKVDGISYLAQVQANGASAVVVPYAQVQRALKEVSIAVLGCDDVLSSLHSLARSYLGLIPSLQTVGITGSCGKSTTKEAIARITSVLGPTARTPGNLNSEFGLPLSIFGLGRESKYGVFEMGIDHIGEMDRMVSILKPSVAVLTNIGISHLEKMGSETTIASEKARIFHPELKAGFVSRDCKHFDLIQKQASVALGRYSANDIEAQDLGLEGWQLSYGGQTFRIRSVGRHLLEDVVGAIRVGAYLGADSLAIAHALEGFEPMHGRSFVHRSRVTIVDDSYNASLDSTSSILRYLSSLSWGGAKKVVLGPMKELGQCSREAHRSIADILSTSSFSKAYLYGEEMEEAAYCLKHSPYAGEVSYTQSFSHLEAEVGTQSKSGDLYLLKASRSVGMERLIPFLQRRVRSYA